MDKSGEIKLLIEITKTYSFSEWWGLSSEDRDLIIKHRSFKYQHKSLL